MKKAGIVLATVLLIGAFGAPAVGQVSFDGKKTSFHSTPPGGVPLPTALAAPVPGMVGTLTKGRKRHVVTVDATVSSGMMTPGLPWSLSMGVDVNGIPMDPGTTFPDSVVQDCSATFTGPAMGCTVSGTFMIDLDAAEAASPGCCYSVPLIVPLYAGTASNSLITGASVDASMAIRLEKKK